jgi:nitrate/nitrite-specific signal transduction histidine kinase
VVNVQHRLGRPMKILTGAITHLSRREFDEAVPSTTSRDELGSTAQALEPLRTSALEAGIELHFEAVSRPFPAQTNLIMIHEIFAILIDYAIRHNKAGGSLIIRLFDDKDG